MPCFLESNVQKCNIILTHSKYYTSDLVGYIYLFPQCSLDLISLFPFFFFLGGVGGGCVGVGVVFGGFRVYLKGYTSVYRPFLQIMLHKIIVHCIKEMIHKYFSNRVSFFFFFFQNNYIVDLHYRE